MRPKISLTGFCLVITTLVVITSCNSSVENINSAVNAEIQAGHMLATKFCSNCHQFPDPNLLDKKTWQRNVLPAMGKKLGIDAFNGTFSAENGADLSAADYEKIVNYYSSLSPDKLRPQSYPAKPIIDMAVFKTQLIPHNAFGPPPLTTAIAYNPYNGVLYSADAANNLFRWDENLHPTLLKKLPSPATGILFSKDHKGQIFITITCIGSLMPSNISNGKVLQFDINNDRLSNEVIIADSLPRSIKVVPGDFNRAGLIDYVLLGFGHDNGGLYLLKQLPSHRYKKELIRGVPGAIEATIKDINNDGWPDIVCLFAQADEGIWVFLNDHKGGFITKNLMHFPPVFGSNSFQLVDMNHDGKDDIVYAAGDNADYSPILKPYHGVYVFINQGNFTFKQQYFYPINGCGKAIAADFDHDGDMDIATIAYFSDSKNHPSEGAVYLEQTDILKFKPHELPVNKLGRWLVMDVNDFDGDGFPDIALGNFAMNNPKVKISGEKQDIYPLVILQNQSVKVDKAQMKALKK